jgi:hypothetical protein
MFKKLSPSFKYMIQTFRQVNGKALPPLIGFTTVPGVFRRVHGKYGNTEKDFNEEPSAAVIFTPSWELLIPHTFMTPLTSTNHFTIAL